MTGLGENGDRRGLVPTGFSLGSAINAVVRSTSAAASRAAEASRRSGSTVTTAIAGLVSRRQSRMLTDSKVANR